MKKFFVFPLISIVLLATLAFWWFSVTKAPSSNSSQKRFVITKGASAIQVGNKLEEAGLVKSALAFKFLVQITGNSAKIQAGEYTLSANLSLTSLLGELLKGPREVWVTIPEGLRREEISQKFAQSFGLTDPEAEVFHQQFLSNSLGKEGYLFPDTYLFPRTASASAVVAKMVNTFDKVVDFEITRQEITLASILERETITEEEKPVVAGILLKRASSGWPLQTDATVQYAIANSKCGSAVECDWWPRPLTREDLNINSPFNTYKFQGFPPGPISNPGLSSLKAAANPEDSVYWFYLHDAKGVIHYATSIEEHNSNISKYLGK